MWDYWTVVFRGERARAMDDNDWFNPCIGTGSTHAIDGRRYRKKKQPIGFIHDGTRDPIPVAVLGAVQGHHKASLILKLNSVSYILGRDQIKALILILNSLECMGPILRLSRNRRRGNTAISALNCSYRHVANH